MRQIVLDTETTGLEPEQGHKIIEIGCVEIVNRRLTDNSYHQYLQPDREIDAGAIEVHGITNDFLQDKPRFIDIVDSFIEFIRGAELIIHNAPFDVGFINHELKLFDASSEVLENYCTVTDTLKMARQLHPGQKNSLDALCKRYAIDNSQRTLHGALLDAEILADVYLAMTGGQTSLALQAEQTQLTNTDKPIMARDSNITLPVVMAAPEEMESHEAFLEKIRKSASGECLWDMQ